LGQSTMEHLILAMARLTSLADYVIFFCFLAVILTFIFLLFRFLWRAGSVKHENQRPQ
jgi:hypothetical protein